MISGVKLIKLTCYWLLDAHNYTRHMPWVWPICQNHFFRTPSYGFLPYSEKNVKILRAWISCQYKSWTCVIKWRTKKLIVGGEIVMWSPWVRKKWINFLWGNARVNWCMLLDHPQIQFTFFYLWKVKTWTLEWYYITFHVNVHTLIFSPHIWFSINRNLSFISYTDTKHPFMELLIN